MVIPPTLPILWIDDVFHAEIAAQSIPGASPTKASLFESVIKCLDGS